MHFYVVPSSGRCKIDQVLVFSFKSLNVQGRKADGEIFPDPQGQNEISASWRGQWQSSRWTRMMGGRSSGNKFFCGGRVFHNPFIPALWRDSSFPDPGWKPEQSRDFSGLFKVIKSPTVILDCGAVEESKMSPKTPPVPSATNTSLLICESDYFTLMNRLCYMAQLTLGLGDYLGSLDLITRAL